MAPKSASVISARPAISDRKSTRLNSSHTVIYTLSLHDALPIYRRLRGVTERRVLHRPCRERDGAQERQRDQREACDFRSEEHTSELQSHRDLHSFPTRRSSDLSALAWRD